MKIEKLTKAQEAEMIKTREQWLAIGRSCERVDRGAIRDVIGKMYEAIKEKKPVVFFFPSPLQCVLAYEVLKSLSAETGANLRDNLWDNLRANLRANLGANLRANLGANLWANLRANLWDNLGANLWDNLGDNLRDNLWDNLGANLWDNLGANLWDNLGDNLRDNLWDNLGDNLRANLGANLRDNLGDNLWDNLGANLRDNLGDNLRANLGANLRANLWDNLRDNLGDVPNYFGGQHWCGWEVFYDFCNQIGVPYAAVDRLKLDLWLEQSKACHWWFPFKNIVLASDRHSILNLDARGRLHSTTQKACAYTDGWGVYAIHGVRVPAYVIEEPIEITPEKIEAEANTEIRRCMVEQYVGGMGKYLLDSNATVVHKDEFGTLYRKAQKDDEDIWMVHVVCPSTQREYFLGVDPAAYGGLKTARAAVASTWREADGSLLFKSPTDYAPLIES